MARRVPSKDVLDVNAVLQAEVAGQLTGRFVPAGPNAWDDYELLDEHTGEILQFGPGLHLHLEPLGAAPALRFRVRRGHEVLRIQWLPTDHDRQEIASGRWGVQEGANATLLERLFGLAPEDDPRDDMLAYFLSQLAEPFEPAAGLGVTAQLVKKLRGL